MRSAIIVFVLLLAPLANAQDAQLSIPFAPVTPATFAIEEVRERTFEQAGQTQTRSGRVMVRLEMRTPGEAVWTTISADPAAIVIDNGGADPTLLIGEPIVLRLTEEGAAAAIADWNGVRRRMFRIMLRNERDQFWREAYQATERMMSDWSPEVAAQTLMETLNILSACHNTNLTPGRVEAFDAPLPNSMGGPPIVSRVSWELLVVDRDAGLARIRHSRAPELASVNASAGGSTRDLVVPKEEQDDTIEAAQQSIECEVDLRSGMVRSALFEVRMILGGETEVRRRQITVTAQ